MAPTVEPKPILQTGSVAYVSNNCIALSADGTVSANPWDISPTTVIIAPTNPIVRFFFDSVLDHNLPRKIQVCRIDYIMVVCVNSTMKRPIIQILFASKWSVLFGGAEGSRTPVRKQLDKTFYGRSLLFTFPFRSVNKHTRRISSFMMHGTGKAYRTHVHHSDHTRARLVVLPGRMGA